MKLWVDAQLSPHLAPWLAERYGPPPQVIWITMGNTSNARMREVLDSLLPDALALLERGETLVEIGDRP